MHYDVLAESVRLLDGAAPAQSTRLSRRVRFLPLASDRDGDVAATMFLRRGVSGIPELDVHTLELTSHGWRVLGGGSGPGYDATEPRRRLADLGAAARSSSGGGTARTTRSRLGVRRDGWVAWAEVRLVEEAVALRVGTRLLPVAAHGCAVVVWTKKPPAATALDAAGAELGPVAVRTVG